MNRAYNSKKLLQKKKRAKKWKLIIFCVVVVLLIGGFFYWMRHPSLNIENIVVSKNHFSKAEGIQARVSEVLDDNILLLIPKTNVLFLPRYETEKKLKEEFPEIENIDIDLNGFKEIEIEVFEYEPEMVWFNGDNKSYFINKEGNIFLEEPLLHSYKDLLILESKMENTELGMNIIDSEFLESLNSFSENLIEIEIEIKKVKHSEEDVYRIETNKDFEIVVSSNDDFDASFENIEVILEDGTLKKEDLHLVDYVDLRFGNKVFYKLK